MITRHRQMRRPGSLVCRALAALLVLRGASLQAAQETWILDGTSNIGGHATTVTGNPTIVATPFGNGLRFDGNDGLIVNANPIAGASSFTIELLLRPDVHQTTALDQPRILHIQSATPPDHRATLEGRIVNGQWYLDAFLRTSATASLTLIDAAKLHPADRWYSYALVYDGATMRVYLNGELELSGTLAISPLVAGQTSLGMRLNQVNFYAGDLAIARFATSALAPADLLSSRIPGDYDGGFYSPGGGIDAADLAVWRNQYGSAGPWAATGDNADGNQDGAVDGRDFLLWQQRFGASPAAAPVPEPAGFSLLRFAAIATSLATGRRPRIRSNRAVSATQDRCLRNACGDTPNTLLKVREK